MIVFPAILNTAFAALVGRMILLFLRDLGVGSSSAALSVVAGLCLVPFVPQVCSLGVTGMLVFMGLLIQAIMFEHGG